MSSPPHPLESPVLARLGELRIPFKRHKHPPVATVEAASLHWAGLKGTYLVVAEHSGPATHFVERTRGQPALVRQSAAERPSTGSGISRFRGRR